MPDISLADHKCMCPQGDGICGQPAALHIFDEEGGQAMSCMVHAQKISRNFIDGHKVTRFCGMPGSLLLFATRNSKSRCVDEVDWFGPPILTKPSRVRMPFQMGTR